MADFEAGGHKYRTAKMDGRRQFYVGIALWPIVDEFFGNLKAAKISREEIAAFARSGGESASPQPEPEGRGEEKFDFLVKMIDVFMRSLGKVPRKDLDFVIDECLEHAWRNQAGIWSPVRAAGGPTMFDDMGMKELMAVVGAVVWENLGGFFSEGASAPGTSSGAKARG